ncbi:MAG: radical SAM family heme chaperone HemW [Actinomycetota bacterium]
MTPPHATFGVYIHVPFCSRRCDYCAFATWDDKAGQIDAYMTALLVEVQRATDAGMPFAETVFVGGGTPSLVPGESLAQVVAAVRKSSDAEVTVECNPDNVTETLLRTYRDAGVNRISLGVQSMVPHVLAGLGREHNPDNVVAAVDAIRSVGLPTFNLDLIYGAHGESLDDWQATLRSALTLSPPHVSAYALTVEAGTPLADDDARHPDDDDQADKYPMADAAFEEAGLANYEISNWAIQGHESRHNRLYWAQADYRGFGCAAHSHTAGRRWWNVRTPERYVDLVNKGESTEAAFERLTGEQIAAERVQLTIRRREGTARTDIAPEKQGEIEEMAADGLLVVVDDRVVLTQRGRLLANAITLRLT